MFIMGCSPKGDKQCQSDEIRHEVKVSTFYAGIYEVSQTQWMDVYGEKMYGEKISWFDAKKECLFFSTYCKEPSYPMEVVSWNQVQEFLKKLNEMEKEKKKPEENCIYRLPTEAEWEYLAKARSDLKYYWGNELGSYNANCYGCNTKWDNKRTSPAGIFSANAFGLYDTSGNVYEWVFDWYGNYDKGESVDPQGPKSGNRRVIRGGSWGNSARHLRLSYRYDTYPGSRNDDMGFRLVLSCSSK